jgi:hypothetical protein
MELTHARLIEISRSSITTAQRVVSDNAFAVAEARRIYSRGARSWKRHQKFARLTLRRAAEFGLTAQKPYKIVDYNRGKAVIGMLGDMACPLWRVEKK